MDYDFYLEARKFLKAMMDYEDFCKKIKEGE